MDFPKLRYVEAFPVTSNGEKFVCLRDPLNMTDRIVVLPIPVYHIVSMFDGSHSLRDIQAEYMRKFGQLLYTEKIQEIIQQLDVNLFLESQNYLQRKLSLERDFLAAPVRRPVHAGASYPSDPQELRRKLDQHFEEARQEGSMNVPFSTDVPRAIIAPHIDLRVGSVCYAWAYERIKAVDFELFVILGTAHAPTAQLFAATTKDYDTPLGTVKTHRPLVEELKQRCGNILFQDEFVHKQEHSIEFQTVFLQYLFGGKEFQVLPILCGSFHQILYDRRTPQETEVFHRFVNALREILEQTHMRTCLIAAADLAHIGLRFGDPTPPARSELDQLEQEDRSKLRLLERLDREGFWESIQSSNDRRRICGLPCIYTMLSVLKAERGCLLKYGQMDDRNTGSAVSYASMVFH